MELDVETIGKIRTLVNGAIRGAGLADWKYSVEVELVKKLRPISNSVREDQYDCVRFIVREASASIDSREAAHLDTEYAAKRIFDQLSRKLKVACA